MGAKDCVLLSLEAFPIPCILWIFDITWKGRVPQALQSAFFTSIKVYASLSGPPLDCMLSN